MDAEYAPLVALQFVASCTSKTEPVPFEQAIDEFIEHLHSTSTLARIRLGNRTEAFDAELRSVFARHGVERVRYGVRGYVAWGRPN